MDGYDCVFVCVYSPYIVLLIFSHNGGTRIKKTMLQTKHTLSCSCVMAWVCVFSRSFGIPCWNTHIPLQTHVADIYSSSADITLATYAGGRDLKKPLLPVWEPSTHTDFFPHLWAHLHFTELFSLVCFVVQFMVSYSSFLCFVFFQITCLHRRLHNKANLYIWSPLDEEMMKRFPQSSNHDIVTQHVAFKG